MASADRPGSREPRIVALDGIRGVAILLVIAHNVGSVPGADRGLALKLWSVVSNAGWVGVQMFFALSGFLITRILLDGKGAPAYLRRFYLRRVLRIVPVYYALLAFVFFVVPHVALFSNLAGHGAGSTLWYWAYLSNWVGAFGRGARALPHVWSLAVEEQFYLFWPLVILAFSERAFARVCVTLVVAALAFRVLLHAVLPAEFVAQAAYEFTVTRWDALALGALVALAVRTKRASAFTYSYIPAAFAATTAILLVSLAWQHGLPPQGDVAEAVNVPFTGVWSALIVLACVNENADTWTARFQGVVRRLLSAKWLVWIGKYSYAIYIFHMPVSLMLRPFTENSLVANSATLRFVAVIGYVFVVLAISALLALVSWNVLEKPMLSLKRYFPMPVSGRP